MKIEDLLEKYKSWIDKLVGYRKSNDEKGYRWIAKDFAVSDLKYKTFFDTFERSDLNSQYASKYNMPNESKQPYAYLQQEVNMINSFHKGFAMRHKTRIQWYRNDISQKDVHTYTAVNNAVGKFKALREQVENGKAWS